MIKLYQLDEYVYINPVHVTSITRYQRENYYYVRVSLLDGNSPSLDFRSETVRDGKFREIVRELRGR